MFDEFLPIVIILAAVWTMPWKGVALWKAAKANSKIWFIILLLTNTLAILEILYIFIFSERKKSADQISSQSPIQPKNSLKET